MNGYPDTYYASTVELGKPRPALSGEHETDVCVIGAGFSGISTALHLAELGVKVTVLEANRVGWGASGRNAGQIVNGLHRELSHYEQKCDAQTYLTFKSLQFEGGRIVHRIIDDYSIDCDLGKTQVMAATNSKWVAEIEQRLSDWQQTGEAEAEIVKGDRIQDFVNVNHYKALLVDHQGGSLNPLKLVLAEAQQVEKLGGTIHEHALVTRLETCSSTTRVYTESGCVRAKNVVVCGNAYLKGLIPAQQRRSIVAGSQLIWTEPLDQNHADNLIPSRACIEEGELDANFYRLTHDNRMLFGAGLNLGHQNREKIMQVLRPRMLKLFPSLKDASIVSGWSGNFLMTANHTPQINRIGDSNYYAQGYNAFGITTTHLAGRSIAQAITSSSAEFDAFSKLTHIPIVGGKLLRVPYLMTGAYVYRFRDRFGI
jgi:gamma-glutamylputrescine oxidase